jgi:catechol 2,3-dioxygenase-like lactoylglutathione lyase family enzyme
MKVGAMRLATVGVSDMDEALRLFRDTMELVVEDEGQLPAALLAAWGLDDSITARYAELSCKGYPVGRLRLVQYQPGATIPVRSDHGFGGDDLGTDVGPKALDFYVADPIGPSVEKIEKLGYKFRSPPVKHQIGDSISEECLFSGPDGLPVLLMVGHSHQSTSLRDGSPDGPFSEIPTISVVAGDLDATRQFYEGALGMVAVTDDETPEEYRNLVDDLTGVPHGTRIYFLVYVDEGEASGKILLVHFFDQTSKRLEGRMRPGRLGFSLLTHDCDDLDALHSAVTDAGATVLRSPTAVGDSRIMLVEGPNCELFEFVEPGDT